MNYHHIEPLQPQTTNYLILHAASKEYQSIALNQLRFAQTTNRSHTLQTTPHDLPLPPAGRYTLARFQQHAAVPFKSPLAELPLVAFNLPLQHLKSPLALHNPLPPLPAIYLLAVDLQRSQPVPPALVELPLVDDAVLVLADPPSSLLALQHLPPKLDLADVALDDELQHRVQRQPPLHGRLVLLRIHNRREIGLTPLHRTNLRQDFVLLETQLHHHLLQLSDLHQQRRALLLGVSLPRPLHRLRTAGSGRQLLLEFARPLVQPLDNGAGLLVHLREMLDLSLQQRVLLLPLRNHPPHRLHLPLQLVILINNELDIADLLPEIILQLANLTRLDHQLLLDATLVAIHLSELTHQFLRAFGVQNAGNLALEGVRAQRTYHRLQLQSQCDCNMALFERECRLANSCLMAAAIEFNLAMFHIFSGPLFANLEGYVFLDLLIWGVSPLLFHLCRNPLRRHITQPPPTPSTPPTSTVPQRRSAWLTACSLSIAIAYLFLNYSESFRWNYFSRIVNLDFGFLLFDLACRCMELVVQLEQQEQHQHLTGESSLEGALHRGGYCKYRNMLMMASYFLVFYLSTLYDTDELTSGKEIFRSLSLLSCLFTISIPVLYHLRNRPQEYGQLPNDEDLQQIANPKQPSTATQPYSPKQIAKTYVVFGLVSFSFFVNSSYFSMWIMQGLKNQNDKHHQQFNKTLFISSAFFLASSFFQFVASHTYIACTIKEGLNTSTLPKLISPFLSFYGLLMLAMFSMTRQLQWHHIAIAILPFSFHYMLVNYFSQRISCLREFSPTLPTHHQIFFYCQSIAYLVIPAFLALVGQSTAALWIFGYLSAASLILSGLFYSCP